MVFTTFNLIQSFSIYHPPVDYSELISFYPFANKSNANFAGIRLLQYICTSLWPSVNRLFVQGGRFVKLRLFFFSYRVLVKMHICSGSANLCYLSYLWLNSPNYSI
jgi:hypothetical protein